MHDKRSYVFIVGRARAPKLESIRASKLLWLNTWEGATHTLSEVPCYAVYDTAYFLRMEWSSIVFKY
jgi:hypothetical protein